MLPDTPTVRTVFQLGLVGRPPCRLLGGRPPTGCRGWLQGRVPNGGPRPTASFCGRALRLRIAGERYLERGPCARAPSPPGEGGVLLEQGDGHGVGDLPRDRDRAVSRVILVSDRAKEGVVVVGRRAHEEIERPAVSWALDVASSAGAGDAGGALGLPVEAVSADGEVARCSAPVAYPTPGVAKWSWVISSSESPATCIPSAWRARPSTPRITRPSEGLPPGELFREIERFRRRWLNPGGVGVLGSGSTSSPCFWRRCRWAPAVPAARLPASGQRFSVFEPSWGRRGRGKPCSRRSAIKCSR
jgi:hypothetical protein